eukprot:62017-Amphidinium_carterae.1
MPIAQSRGRKSLLSPLDRPQALSVDGPQRVPHAPTTLHVHGEQNNDPISDMVSDMVRMTQELIASIQTSARPRP